MLRAMVVTRRPRVYLAGPDIFLPEAQAQAGARTRICAEHGLVGATPFDDPPVAIPGWDAMPEWQQLFLANEAHIRAADAVIANLTPFRGPSADPGTVYEVGLARGLEKPVFGYATTTQGFAERTRAAWGPSFRDPGGTWRDRDGLSIEDFALFDNLMVVGSLSVLLLAEDIPEDRRWSDLSVFTRCVATAARVLYAARGVTPD
jgi:nucleoside 2-deoxyribosyltransferase